MPLIESQSFTNQAINVGKVITFAAPLVDYEQVNLRVFLYDLAAVSSAKTAVPVITKAGTAVESRLNLTPTLTTAGTSLVLSSDLFTLGAGDVLKITIVGGANDTANVDIVAELWGIPDLSALITIVDTVVDAIKAKTDNLPTDPADESLLEAAIAAIPSAPSVAQIDTQLSGTHGVGSWGSGSGSGAVSTTVTVTVSSLPRDGVEVWVTTDLAGLNVVANGVTDALGEVDFLLDAGTYFVWKQLAGVNFTNPQTMVVS